MKRQVIVKSILSFMVLSIIAYLLLLGKFQETNTSDQTTVEPVLTPTPLNLQPGLITPTSNAGPFPLVRLAWFTNIPRDEDLLNVLQWFDLFILHHRKEEERDMMIAMGARGPILQYLLFEAIQDPGSCTASPDANQIAYMPGDFCLISEQHPDWFLLDTQGRRIVKQDDDNNLYLMDPGNPGWRSYFLDRIKQTQADPNWNGVFLDNVPVTLAFQEKSGYLPAAYPDDASLQIAVQGFLQYLYENYFQPEKKLLFANLVSRRDDAVWTSQIMYLDGVMHEGWAIDWPNGYRPAETWEKQMELAEQTQKMGKSIILVAQGTREDTSLQKFAFASYLLINQGNAFFRYANSNKYRDVWMYDDYRINLGTPLGLRYRDGTAWRRDFAHGSVMVNPETHKVEINIK